MEKFLKRYSSVPNGFIEEFFNIAKESYNDNDFTIDLDIVAAWLDIRKDNLKRILAKNFEENYDFVISTYKTKNSDNRGTHYTELILLTPDCFKEFCMINRTPTAKEVRKYYVSIEKLIRKYHEHIENRLNKKIGLLKTNQKPKINIEGGIIYFFRALNESHHMQKLI